MIVLWKIYFLLFSCLLAHHLQYQRRRRRRQHHKKVYVYDLLVGKYTKFLITIYIKRTKQNQTRAKHITYTHTQLLQVEKQQQQQKKEGKSEQDCVCWKMRHC